MTFASRIIKEGWILAKAQYFSLLHGRGPETAGGQVLKPFPTEAILSLNHITRLGWSVALMVDSKSNSKKTEPWVLRAADRALIKAAL